MQMLEEIAKVGASTTWCPGKCSVCAMIAASLDHDAARWADIETESAVFDHLVSTGEKRGRPS